MEKRKKNLWRRAKKKGESNVKKDQKRSDVRILDLFLSQESRFEP